MAQTTTYSKLGFAIKLLRHSKAGLWSAFFFAYLMTLGGVGCSAIEKSEFEKGEEEAGDGVDDSADTDGTDDGGEPNALDTGLTTCVRDGLADRDDIPYEPPELTDTLTDYADRSETLTEDEFFDLTDLLLRQVIATSGAVDYDALKGEYATQFDLILDSLATMTPPDSQDGQLAFWTNTYNLVMMKTVIEKSLTDVSTDFPLFKEERTIAGHELSLDAIEKGILQLAGGTEDHPEELRLPEVEPRLHFALNCAAVSCPKVRNFAYRADNMDIVLTENEAMFFNSKTHISTSDGVEVSSLFRWFAGDFDTLAGGADGLSRRNMVETKVLSECRDDLTEIAEAFEANEFSELSSLDYDWTVNAQ